MTPLRAPFPWFGGKRRVAADVWRAFGADVPNYVEPFAGSLAVLLARPTVGKIETVNDADRYVANFWRAVTADPWAVAEWCDGPVNEADLHARHRWLVNQIEFRERMHEDPSFYDVKVAGWWVWGVCQWIGGGWCRGPHALKKQLPHLIVTNANGGIAAGRGVHSAQAYSPDRRVPLSTSGTHLHAVRELEAPDAPPCFAWFSSLCTRLRRVRVACGDWTRVLGKSVLGKGKGVGGRRPCAVFLDPPYEQDLRCSHLYTEDSSGISARVREWALENGDDPDLRIALCGYEGEHVMPPTWRELKWNGARGYASDGNANREKERLWLSPHCLLETAHPQGALFKEMS